jgi:hypothetical protein
MPFSSVLNLDFYLQWIIIEYYKQITQFKASNTPQNSKYYDSTSFYTFGFGGAALSKPTATHNTP